MRAFLIDDEKLAIRQLQYMLENEFDNIEIIGTFYDPSEVIPKAIELKPDVVFLDIHMPEVNGLRLGEQLQEVLQDIEIVFVTGFDQYAVQAFELYALDYIMKPVQIGRLRQTVLRLNEKLSNQPTITAETDEHPIIHCFRSIRFQLPGQDPIAVKWRTSKVQELFAYLLHYRNQTIDRSTLIDLLWPDFDDTRAAQQLYTSIYHIRQTLKANGLGIITISSGEFGTGYRLMLGDVMIDTELWEQKLKKLGAVHSENIQEHRDVHYRFEGNYLEEYNYLWAEHERERLRNILLHHTKSLVHYYLEQRELNEVIQISLRIQQLMPDKEESYFTLMIAYNELKDQLKVEEQYWMLTSKIEQELDTKISIEIKQWYEQ